MEMELDRSSAAPLLDKVVDDAALLHCIGSKIGFKLASEWGGRQ
jgi:hypothetical protein